LLEPKQWLDGLVSTAAEAERSTIICRTQATQREVLRAFAARAVDEPAGWPGVEVLTLRPGETAA